MRKIINFTLILLTGFFSLAPKAFSQVDLGIESGIVFSGYNDVRIPGAGGTLFSLSEELKADPGAFYRVQVFYNFNDRHHLGVLYAPLMINSTGQLGRDLIFEGETFTAAAPLEATYKFNSYRLIYRYDLLRKDKIDLKAGYRILEGGADNDEVYNFALINYASIGAIYHF